MCAECLLKGVSVPDVFCLTMGTNGVEFVPSNIIPQTAGNQFIPWTTGYQAKAAVLYEQPTRSLKSKYVMPQ